MIYPPRPETRVSLNQLPLFEKLGFFAQVKLNGSRCVVILQKDSVQVYNRHRELMTLTPDADLHSLYTGTGTMILDGECLNKSQAADIEIGRAFCIFDILMCDGEELLGTNAYHRQMMLDQLWPEADSGYLTQIQHNLYRVNRFETGFTKIYKEVTQIPVYEGLVMKNPAGKLMPMITENNNSSWQVKCRKPSKMYKQ